MKSPAHTDQTKSPLKNAGSRSSSFFKSVKNDDQPFFEPAFIQAKLEMGEPDDPYEKQADRVADAVVQMPDTSQPVQRQEMEEEEELQMKREPILQRKCKECEEQENLQKKSNNFAQSQNTASEDVSSHLRANSGKGNQLPRAVRSEMSQKIGADFSDVNIHTNDDASQMNKSIGARAFTHGKDIYFNSGEYNPSTQEGKHLLAHELTHVVQQRGDIFVPKIQKYEFGDELAFEPIPGPSPKVRLLGPYSDEAIAEELYGDRSVPIRHDPQEESIIFIEEIRLLDQWRPYFGEQLVEQDQDFLRYTAEQRAQAGLFALGTTLNNSSEVVEIIRNLYNNGIREIINERARLIRQVLPTQQADDVIRALGSNLERSEMVRILSEALPESEAARIAERVANMRHQLAINARAVGGTILRKGAELVDTVRSQARPTYASLRADGKTNAQIIASATRTNHFVNRLPSGMRVAGKGLWLASAGMSIYIVLSADDDERARVAREEIGAFVGGAAGTAAFSSLCVATGIATGGLGLVACGVLGGVVGGAVGRDPYGFLQFMDIAPHTNTNLAGRMFRLEGDFDVSDFFIFRLVHRRVEESEHIIVIGTGQESGSLMGGRGHYRSYQVAPANTAAVELFGGSEPQWIPNYILHSVSEEDILSSEDSESDSNQIQRKQKTKSLILQ
jgi:hypothetical protein